jgi:hypothetical protein
MSRIRLEHAGADALWLLSEGNPGALTVLLEIQKQSRIIDADSLDPLLTILLFDTFGIYGSSIWVLHKDICEQNVARTIAVVRAAQLGLIPPRTVVEACRDEADPACRPTIRVETVVGALRTRLPRFDPDNLCGVPR